MRRDLLRAAVAGAVVGLVALSGSGCGGDDGEAPVEQRDQLEESLGFLEEDLGLTDAQVACTAQAIEDDLGGDDLDRFAEQVRQIDAGEVSVDDLPEADSVILTGAIAGCAADG